MNTLQRWKFDRALDRAWSNLRSKAATSRLPRKSLDGVRIINRTGYPTDWEFFDSQGNKMDLPVAKLVFTGEPGEVPIAKTDVYVGSVHVLAPEFQTVERDMRT